MLVTSRSLLFAGLIIAAIGQEPALALDSLEQLSSSPVYQEQVISSERPDNQFVVQYDNHETSSLSIKFSLLELTDPTDYKSVLTQFFHDPHSTTVKSPSWLIADTTSVVILPGAAGVFTAHSAPIATIAAGTHFAILIAQPETVTPMGALPATEARVDLQQSLVSFLTLTNETGAINSLVLDPLRLPPLFWTLPSTFTLSFRNRGNTQRTPHGLIDLTDRHGQIAARGIINADSALTLPGSVTKLIVPIHRLVQPSLLPSRYQVLIRYHDDTGELRTSTAQFFVIGGWPIIALLGGSFFMGLVWGELRRRPKPKHHWTGR